MLKFSPTVPVRFYAKEAGYISGEGQNTTWIDKGVLYSEWRGAYGDRVTAAQAIGVSDSATIRTFYHPEIFDALCRSRVVAIRNDDPTGISNGVPDRTNPNVYELWGGVDNAQQENQFLEFRVRRYEGK